LTRGKACTLASNFDQRGSVAVRRGAMEVAMLILASPSEIAQAIEPGEDS
jgi:hypothetical protein